MSNPLQQAALAAVERYGSIRKAADTLGINRTTMFEIVHDRRVFKPATWAKLSVSYQAPGESTESRVLAAIQRLQADGRRLSHPAIARIAGVSRETARRHALTLGVQTYRQSYVGLPPLETRLREAVDRLRERGTPIRVVSLANEARCRREASKKYIEANGLKTPRKPKSSRLAVAKFVPPTDQIATLAAKIRKEGLAATRDKDLTPGRLRVPWRPRVYRNQG